MRITLLCYKCIDENKGELAKLYSEVVREDGHYTLTCDRGHESSLLLIDEKYAILFEIALHAIVDGYHREAVASATASLERFYEFATRVMLRESGVSPGEFENAWGHVRSQSERQLGMFLATFTLHFKCAPSVLAKKSVERRNDVIHKGVIPSEENAVGYLAEVSSLIGETVIKLREGASSGLKAVCLGNWKKSSERNFAFSSSHLGPHVAEPIFRNTTIESRLQNIRAKAAAVESTNPRTRKSLSAANRPFRIDV
jgi:hypothetical protein